jgi:hypothetical protein
LHFLKYHRLDISITMMVMSNNKALVLLLAAALAVSGTTAFGVNRMGSTRKVATTFLSSPLYAAASANDESSATTEESASAEEPTAAADAAAAAEEPSAAAAEEKEEEPVSERVEEPSAVVEEETGPPDVAAEEPVAQVEDPAVAALKQEIADMESAVKAKTRQLTVAQEQAERYTKTGYARRVAEVENTRRVRKVRRGHGSCGLRAALAAGISSLKSLDRIPKTHPPSSSLSLSDRPWKTATPFRKLPMSLPPFSPFTMNSIPSATRTKTMNLASNTQVSRVP